MSGPLLGYRGVVLTQAWAGAFCTELLGLMGADIIQVEVRKRPDSWRGSYDAPLPTRLGEVEAARHPWNCNPLYNSVNLNKRCVTLDLQADGGMATFRKLLRHADFVAENFSPRVLGNLGIGYEQMTAINPGVILCSLSAYGHSGPWENVPGIGGTIEPTSGMSALLGYPDGPPLNSGQMYPDAVAGLNAVAAIVTALRHRERTGRGQYIDLSMQEANLAFVGDAALEYLRTGRERTRAGNRHPAYAPHGIYPSAGVDRWVAISCHDDQRWTQLATILAIPSDVVAARASIAARKADEGMLDAVIAAATRSWERDALVQRLLDAGICAAPVLDGLEVAADPGLRERGVVVEVEHPEAGSWPQAAAPWRFSRSGMAPVRPAPLLGQHSFEVFSELLGMTRDEYETLVDTGVSGTGPPG
ncbi:MAG: CoA transferase [Dehalococcoidia bacterium]|nr:CoA transferase [Dehalococcoidia bacterium]